jgi:hypothetical protein
MAETHHRSHADLDNVEVHHETTDVNIRAIFAFGAGLIAVAVVIHLLVWLLFVYFSSSEAARAVPRYPLAAEGGNRLPPDPRLQTNPRQDLADLRAREDALLGSYEWVDKRAGIARIPIDEAMKLVVQRGLPARSASETPR